MGQGPLPRSSLWRSCVADSAMPTPWTMIAEKWMAACRPAEETGFAELAGPLPGDGFMGESPAPRRGTPMQTLMQDKQHHNSTQVSRICDRPAPGL